MKKGLAAILALTMTMGMTVPAMAAQPTREEALECFELTTSVDDETNGQGVFVKTEEPFRLGDFDQDLPPEEYYDFGSGDYKFTEYDSYNAIRQDSKIRLKNTAPKGKNVYLTASMQCYVDKYYGEDTPEDIPEYNPNVPIFFNGASADFTDTPIITLEDGTYIYLETVGYQLAEDGFVPSYRGEWIEIQPGETAEFDLNKDFDTLGFGYDLHQADGNNMYEIKVFVHFPDENYYWWFSHIFHVDEEAVDNFVPINDPTIYFTEENELWLENGEVYGFVMKNNGTTEIEGYYVLLMYDEDNFNNLQLFPMDVKLAPGETAEGVISSAYFNIFEDKVFWLAFDDKAEREAFFADAALKDVYGARYELKSGVNAAEWVKSLQDRAEG